MTRLLVSVRDQKEAALALAAGVDLIDIKEPRAGALGAADVQTIEQVVDVIAGRAPLSAALGELSAPLRLPVRLARELRYLKLGLAGAARKPDWRTLWSREIDRFPPGVTPVAVAYADAERAQAPPAQAVLANSRAAGCGAILLDTFDKSGGSLLKHWSQDDIAQFIRDAHAKQLLCVIAGGLRGSELNQVCALAPDYIGVRGAICVRDRKSALDRKLLQALVERVNECGRVVRGASSERP